MSHGSLNVYNVFLRGLLCTENISNYQHSLLRELLNLLLAPSVEFAVTISH